MKTFLVLGNLILLGALCLGAHSFRNRNYQHRAPRASVSPQLGAKGVAAGNLEWFQLRVKKAADPSPKRADPKRVQELIAMSRRYAAIDYMENEQKTQAMSDLIDKSDFSKPEVAERYRRAGSKGIQMSVQRMQVLRPLNRGALAHH